MSKKITKEIFDGQGNLVATQEIEVASEPNWSEYMLGFFTNPEFNQIRLLVKESPQSELAAMRVESLANGNTERFDIFVICWNQMIEFAPKSAKDLISEKVVEVWNNICEKAEMPFIYNEKGLLKLV